MVVSACVATTLEKRRPLSPERDARHESRRKALLVSGIVSWLLYGAMIGAIRFEGYSLVSQVPSELTAIGAPTRTLWMWLRSAFTVLVGRLRVGGCAAGGP